MAPVQVCSAFGSTGVWNKLCAFYRANFILAYAIPLSLLWLFKWGHNSVKKKINIFQTEIPPAEPMFRDQSKWLAQMLSLTENNPPLTIEFQEVNFPPGDSLIQNKKSAGFLCFILKPLFEEWTRWAPSPEEQFLVEVDWICTLVSSYLRQSPGSSLMSRVSYPDHPVLAVK